MSHDDASRIIDTALEDELGVAFGRYAKTTILSRAIPDVRDGLKPVQRRILYAMHLARNTADNPYRKCAKTVGEVMGNFHPHGDSSIYDAMVRLAQSWKVRCPLVDGHGNFGSLDDDPPAAMRYTEARLAPIARELLEGLDHDTVDFQPNFDDKDEEPCVLPARYPNLLVNGTSGVSTGFATEIPPHNLAECIDAVVALIDNPNLDLDGAMRFIQGPDFPTGGILVGSESLREAYATGRGRCTLRARSTVETQRDGRQQIVISEIPYGVIKSDLVRDIERLKTEKAIQGVSDVRDESDREGLRIVIDLQKTVEADPVLAFLFKKTELQVYRHFLMVAICDRTPETLSLIAMLKAYLAHQRDVVIRRSKHDLARAEARLHLVDGLIRAVDVLDEVIATIRASKDRPDAHKNLMARFSFTDLQTAEILDLKLHRLTNLQILDLKKEQNELQKLINKLRRILDDEGVLMATIRGELLEVRGKYADPRRTEIRGAVEEVETKIQVAVTVKAQDVVVGLSAGGYIKKSGITSAEKSGGDGGVKDGDVLKWRLETNTLHRIAWFTAQGKAFSLAVHQVPDAKWADAGTALVNVVQIEKDDRVIQVLAQRSLPGEASLRTVPPELALTDFESGEVVFVTRQGSVKRTALADLDARRSTGIAAIKVGDDDEVLAVLLAPPGAHILLVTREGNGIRFPLDEIPVQGRAAAGVRGMKLSEKDRIVSALVVPSEDQVDVALVTEEGRGKRTWLSDFPTQHRGGRGVLVVQRRQRLPHRVAFAVAWPPVAGEFETLRCLRSDNSLITLPAKTLRRTPRDGNAFEFDNPPAGVRVVNGQRNHELVPEGAVVPETPAVEPPPASILPFVRPLTLAGGEPKRAAWTGGVSFLPGFEPPAAAKTGDELDDDTVSADDDAAE